MVTRIDMKKLFLIVWFSLFASIAIAQTGDISNPQTNASALSVGTLPAGRMPALTSDCTTSAGSVATNCLKTNGVAFTTNSTAAVGQLPGTNINDSAAAGKVGEFVTATQPQSTPIALTNNAGANITSISLTAGDWDVWGQVVNAPAGTTNYTLLIAGVGTASATIIGAAGVPGRSDCAFGGGATGGQPNACQISPTQLSLNSTQTVFLVANDAFTVSTMGAYGYISARRRR